MIRFERGDWLGQVFTFHGTIVETLWWPTLIYFVYCTIMFVVAECYALGFDENRLLVDDHGSIRFLGGFVSFLLIFQMNTSFERFTGGINLTAQFFSHLYGSLGIVLGYLRRDGPLPDGMSPDSDDWKRREREALEALATEVHVVRLVLAIGASLKFHVRIAENVLTGGRLPLETVQLLLFDLHRVRGLLLPNEQVIVDQACGLYLEHDQCGTSESGTSRNVSDEPAVQCKFRVRLNYMEDEDSIGGKTAQLEQLASSSSRNLGTEGCAGAPIPLLLVQLLRGHLAKAMETPWGFRERVVNIVEQSLSSVCTSFESLDRLITMPFPLAYLQHSKALFLLFSSVYPLCIGTSLGFWANVVSPTIIFFALLGFEVLADELENPLGSGPQDLNIIEMVHALEVRAAKAFAAAEVQREAISKDQQKFLEESLGLPSQASSSMPAATREKLERVRRFSHHFCWLSLPKHVLMDLARQDTQVPADFAKSCSVQSPRGSLLYQVYDFGGNVRQFLSRQKIRPCADYGILEGEVDATEASPVFQKYLQECVSHFVCLKSQEAAMRSICDEMQGCVRQEEPVGVDSDVEDPVVELRLAGRLTGAANRVSKWMSPGEASRFSESLSAFATLSRSSWNSNMPIQEELHSPLTGASRAVVGFAPATSSKQPVQRVKSNKEKGGAALERKYTAYSKELAHFAIQFAPRVGTPGSDSLLLSEEDSKADEDEICQEAKEAQAQDTEKASAGSTQGEVERRTPILDLEAGEEEGRKEFHSCREKATGSASHSPGPEPLQGQEAAEARASCLEVDGSFPDQVERKTWTVDAEG